MSLQLIEAAKVLRFDPATGWPENFTVNQAIALQTWHEGIAPKAWRSKADDLRILFYMDHGKGLVKVTTTSRTEKVPRSKNVEVTFASMHWDGVPGKRKTVHWVEDVEVKTNHITAEAFAAWLAANEIEPSRHVAAWFKVMAVNTDHRRIEAEPGWKARCDHGLQRMDNTDAGRLVRLADLVQWLMDTRDLPCKAAVEEVCSALEQRSSAAAGWLYMLTENDYARPMPADQSFFVVAEPLSFWETSPPDADSDKGLAGAIKFMRKFWGESRAPGAGNWMGQHVLDPLAVRVDLAHFLFEYGRRVDVAGHTEATASAVPAEPREGAPAEKRRFFKKSALVQELQGEWPTIEKDLSEASRNGLNAAKAKAHGSWDVQKASEWAEGKGKLVKSAKGHTLQAAWQGNKTTHRTG